MGLAALVERERHRKVSLSGPRPASWYEIDITSFVRNEIDAGRTAVTFVIRSPSGGPYMVFNSKEANTGAPVLFVQY